MFNSAYGGIESDGMMNNLRKEQFIRQNNEESAEAVLKQNECEQKSKKGIFGSSFLKNIETDDLILIGIALLLLLDGDGDNDIFVFIIAALVLMS